MLFNAFFTADCYIRYVSGPMGRASRSLGGRRLALLASAGCVPPLLKAAPYAEDRYDA